MSDRQEPRRSTLGSRQKAQRPEARSHSDLPLLRLAWRNTRRNSRRTLLTVTAVTIAVAALIFALSYVDGILANMLDTYARTESGHVRVRAEGYSERERSLPLHLNVPAVSEVVSAVRTQEGVEAALPRIRTTVLVDGAESNQPGLLLGLDLAREEGYLNPEAMVQAGRLPRAGHPEVLLGEGFADKLNVHVGDSLTLLGQTAYRSLGGLLAAVTGIGTTGLGHLDNRLLVAPLDQVQYMTYLTDAATEVVVFANDPADADTLAKAVLGAVAPLVGDEIEVRSWREQGPLVRMIESYQPIMWIILSMLLLMAALIIINTMLMTVMERTQEFGMLAALGMRPSDIVLLVVFEGVVIGLLGAFAGGSLGTAVTMWVEHTGIDITRAAQDIELPFQGMLYPDWKFLYTLLSAFLGTLAATLAALYPAWRAVVKKPAEALRP